MTINQLTEQAEPQKLKGLRAVGSRISLRVTKIDRLRLENLVEILFGSPGSPISQAVGDNQSINQSIGQCSGFLTNPDLILETNFLLMRLGIFK